MKSHTALELVYVHTVYVMKPFTSNKKIKKTCRQLHHNQQQNWNIPPSCGSWHGGWWIINNWPTDSDLSFPLLLSTCHTIYCIQQSPETGRIKRVKCWVTFVLHKSSFKFGITMMGSIICQYWTRGQQTVPNQRDNRHCVGFMFLWD